MVSTNHVPVQHHIIQLVCKGINIIDNRGNILGISTPTSNYLPTILGHDWDTCVVTR